MMEEDTASVSSSFSFSTRTGNRLRLHHAANGDSQDSAATGEEQDADEQPLLFLQSEHVRSLYRVLKAIMFRESAIFSATAEGLKVTVEEAKCVQAHVFIDQKLFREYVLKEQSAHFKINLSILCECLNLFGASGSGEASRANRSTFRRGGRGDDSADDAPLIPIEPTLSLSYEEYGEPLRILLEDPLTDLQTECSIVTQESSEVVDFDFEDVLNKIIMKADILKEAFADFDSSSDYLEILMSPDEPYLRFTTCGQLGVVELEFPKNSDIVETFSCVEKQVNRYRLNLLKPSVRALALADKVSIRTNRRGFLAMQYMIDFDKIGNFCFVGYFCAPEETYEEDEGQSLVIE